MKQETGLRHARFKGTDFILARLHDPDSQVSQSAFLTIQRHLTLDGRIPYQQAIGSLTNFEQRVVGQLEENPNITLTSVPESEDLSERTFLVIQEGHIGHVSILTAEEITSYKPTEPLFVLGAIQFSPDDYQSLESYRKESENRLAEDTKEITSALGQMEQEGQIPAVISNIHENLIRIDPTFVHVGHKVYSTFDRIGKNVIDLKPEGGTKLLSILPQKSVSSWSAEEQIYIYGTHLLLLSGGPARVEELNGSQVSPAILKDFFDKKAEFYCRSTGEEIPEDWFKRSLIEKATWVRSKLEEVNSKYLRYRSINGLTLRQEERIMGPSANFVVETVPQDLLTRINSIFGIEIREGEEQEEYWRRVTVSVIRRNSRNDIPSLPLLIWSIISTAVEATGSDFGMSSTFRDAHKFLKEGPLSLDKYDFYCCVVPSKRVMGLQRGEQASEAMILMASRMEFNRWHFLPASMPREKIPASRHWLYAPAIPDIATETDLHHGGHIDAGVHHSVRYPSPIIVGGTEYRGSYDIRLVRQTGEQYEPSDIVTAGKYLKALGGIYNSVVNYVQETDESVRVEGFTPPRGIERKNGGIMQ